MAALVLAAAFVGHALVDETMQLQPGKKRPGSNDAAKLARKQDLFRDDGKLVERAEALAEMRNAYVHRKQPGDDGLTLGRRCEQRKRAPRGDPAGGRPRGSWRHARFLRGDAAARGDLRAGSPKPEAPRRWRMWTFRIREDREDR